MRIDTINVCKDFACMVKYNIMAYKVINGTKNSETIIGSNSNNIIKAGGGNDIIFSVNGSNIIYTQSKDGDVINFHSGYGADKIFAGKGFETYIFNEPHGVDTIIPNEKGSVVLDVSDLSNLSFTEVGQDLVIYNTYNFDALANPNTEQIIIKNYLKNKYTDNIFITNDNSETITKLDEYLGSIKAVVIDDSVMSKKRYLSGTFLDETIIGGKNNNVIKSGFGKDTIEGGKGNDKLYGNIRKQQRQLVYNDETNAKEYVFNYSYNNLNHRGIGDGKDTIINSKISDKITFKISGKNIDEFKNSLKYSKSGNNLVINYQSSTKNNKLVEDNIVINNYFKIDNQDRIKDIVIIDGENSQAIDLNEVYINYGDKKIYSTKYDDKISGNENDNKYYVSDLSSKTVINDAGGSNDYIKFTKVSKYDVIVSYFDMDKEGNALNDCDSLKLFSWDRFNELGNIDHGVEIEHFLDISTQEIKSGGIGEIETIDKNTGNYIYLRPIRILPDYGIALDEADAADLHLVNWRYSSMNDLMIDSVKQSVIAWFEDNEGFDNTQDVFANGTENDIKSLVSAYAFGYFRPINPIIVPFEEANG